MGCQHDYKDYLIDKMFTESVTQKQADWVHEMFDGKNDIIDMAYYHYKYRNHRGVTSNAVKLAQKIYHESSKRYIAFPLIVLYHGNLAWYHRECGAMLWFMYIGEHEQNIITSSDNVKYFLKKNSYISFDEHLVEVEMHAETNIRRTK